MSLVLVTGPVICQWFKISVIKRIHSPEYPRERAPGSLLLNNECYRRLFLLIVTPIIRLDALAPYRAIFAVYHELLLPSLSCPRPNY